MRLRTISLLILTCTFGLLAYTLGKSDPVAACLSGDDGHAKIAACTSLLESPDIDDETRSIVHLRRAQIHVRLKNNDVALHDLDRAIALDDTHWANYTQRGIVRAKQRKYEAALLDFEKSVELNPISSWTLIWQGNTLADVGQYVEALDVFNKIIANDPEHLTAHRAKLQVFIKTKRANDAFEIADEILRIDPEDLWTLGKRATLRYEAEQYEAAVEDMMQSVRVDPNDWKTAARLGVYLGKTGKTEEAVVAFDQAIELNPKTTYPWLARMDMWLDEENYEEMALDAERAHDLAPNDQKILPYLFVSYLKTGQDAASQKYLDIWARQQQVFRNALPIVAQKWGKDHPIAAEDAQLQLFKFFIYAQPPLEEPDKALKSIELYFEAGGRDAIQEFQDFLENMGLYRGKITGTYDDKTRDALGACLDQAKRCLNEWNKLTTL